MIIKKINNNLKDNSSNNNNLKYQMINQMKINQSLTLLNLMKKCRNNKVNKKLKNNQRKQIKRKNNNSCNHNQMEKYNLHKILIHMAS